MVVFGFFFFSWKSVSVIGWVAIKPTADWNRIVYRTFCMCLLPPISCVGGVILNQRRWYRRFKRGAKTIEIQLCRKEDPDPVTFTHMVLHPGRALMRQGIRKNLLGRLRQTLGPFISAREAWDSVGGGCGLGMGLKQLEVFMTRPRMGKDGKLCDRVVPVILHCVDRGQATTARRRGDGGPTTTADRQLRWADVDSGTAMTARRRVRRGGGTTACWR